KRGAPDDCGTEPGPSADVGRDPDSGSHDAALPLFGACALSPSGSGLSIRLHSPVRRHQGRRPQDRRPSGGGEGGPDLAPSRLGRRASSSATNSAAPVGRYLNPTAQLRSTILTCPRRSERTAVVRPTGGVLPEGG